MQYMKHNVLRGQVAVDSSAEVVVAFSCKEAKFQLQFYLIHYLEHFHSFYRSPFASAMLK